VCAVFQRKGVAFRPGRAVLVVGPPGLVERVWAGFAREEILAWWRQKGGELVDIPADRFAERSEVTGKLVWAEVPPGQVIRGVLDLQGQEPLLKVVTRAASAAEQRHFQHPRHPLLETPLFAVADLPDPPAEEGFLW
jgi:hypothetical protein